MVIFFNGETQDIQRILVLSSSEALDFVWQLIQSRSAANDDVGAVGSNGIGHDISMVIHGRPQEEELQRCGNCHEEHKQ